MFIQVFLCANSKYIRKYHQLNIQYMHTVAIAAQRHMDQAWFPHTWLGRHLISQLNAHSQSPSLSHTPLCSFSNPPHFSLSLAFRPLSVFLNLSFSRPQSLPEPCSISLFLIFSLCHTIRRPSGIFHPTPLSPRHSRLHFLILAHLMNESILQEQSNDWHSIGTILSRFDLTFWAAHLQSDKHNHAASISSR